MTPRVPEEDGVSGHNFKFDSNGKWPHFRRRFYGKRYVRMILQTVKYNIRCENMKHEKQWCFQFTTVRNKRRF